MGLMQEGTQGPRGSHFLHDRFLPAPLLLGPPAAWPPDTSRPWHSFRTRRVHSFQLILVIHGIVYKTFPSILAPVETPMVSSLASFPARVDFLSPCMDYIVIVLIKIPG